MPSLRDPTVAKLHTAEPTPIRTHRATSITPSAVLRFTITATSAIVAAGLVYLWVLWDLWNGRIDPLRTIRAQHTAYDVQARAILHGRLTLPSGSIGAEAFTHHGNTYTYFGLVPSILRIPVLLVTHSLDGRLSALSMSVAWLTTAVFSALLLWRIRVVLRGESPLGRLEVTSYGVLLFSILAGSVLLYLGSQPDVYTEDLTWSVALAAASFFALVGVAERPCWGRLSACGVLVLFTNLNRATTGYACILAAIALAAWFGLGRAGYERRVWAVPVLLLGGLAPMAAGCAIDYAKFGLLFGVPASEQELYKAFGFSHVNGGHYWGLRYLPSTLQAYIDPANIRFTALFPYISLPDDPTPPIAHTILFSREPTASVVPSMPLLFLVGVWGMVSSFLPQHGSAARAMKVLLLAGMATAGSVMIFGWVLERYVADFLPLLILAGMLGLVDIWSRLKDQPRAWRVLVSGATAVLAIVGVVANVGYAVAPNANWSQVEADHFVRAQRTVSDLTGHPLAGDVVKGSGFPIRAPQGRLFIEGQCKALYVANQKLPSRYFFSNVLWVPVERAPHTPICDSLLATAQSLPLATNVIFPGPGQSVSGPGVLMSALSSAGGQIVSVSFVLSGDSLHHPTTIARTSKTVSGFSVYSWDSRSVPNGSYELRSAAIDAAGRIATSSGVSITVHNAPVNSPSMGKSGST